MVNTNKLLGIIAEQGTTQKAVAKACNITPKTFYNKMAKKVFNSNEIEAMINFLNIDDPVNVFFTPKVTY